jgi:hypothetical protein
MVVSRAQLIRGTVLLVIGVGAVALVLALAGGCSSSPAGPCPPTAASNEVAESSEVTERAADYRGAGPHPLIVLGVVEDDPESLVVDTDLLGAFPADWLPRTDTDGHYIGIQLVACKYPPVADAGAPLLGFCDYEGTPNVPVVAATRTFRVYEAATARLVHEFDVRGVRVDCPAAIYRDNDDDAQPRIIIEPDTSDVLDGLRPLVKATR